jgi:hypothetical protein
MIKKWDDILHYIRQFLLRKSAQEQKSCAINREVIPRTFLNLYILADLTIAGGIYWGISS